MKKLAFLIDDCSPVNLMTFHEPQLNQIRDFPPEFFQKFKEVLDYFQLKGKLSLIPLPGGELLSETFVEYMKSFSSDHWDFSLEGITHMYEHPGTNVREDTFFDMANSKEISKYFQKGIRMAKEAFGIETTSITSPWYSGAQNVRNYESGMFAALSAAFPHQTRFWYFLFITSKSRGKDVRSSVRKAANGKTLFHVPALVDDFFWRAQDGPEHLEEDYSGLQKRTRDLFAKSDDDVPLITVLTHWQSLFSNGNWQGLQQLINYCTWLQTEYAGKFEYIKISDYVDTL